MYDCRRLLGRTLKLWERGLNLSRAKQIRRRYDALPTSVFHEKAVNSNFEVYFK